jgi:hypothetical protein
MHRVHSIYGDTETVKQLMADLLKVETNVHFCPLVSLYKLLCFITYARMS